MSELRALRTLVKPSEQVTQQMIDAYKAQIAEAAKLKGELDLIQDAIIRTKQEIATVHVTGFEGPENGARHQRARRDRRRYRERRPTPSCRSAEEIDQLASTLAARLKDEQSGALVQDIQERVIKIFEACNFQDLTGQRITKVVATLKFIETHIMRMMEIWGGLEAFKEHRGRGDGAARGGRQAAPRAQDRGRGRPRLAGRDRRAVCLKQR